MKNNILLFGFSRTAHAGLIAALREEGFTLTATVSLTKLHILVVSRRFDAILVSGKIVDLHKMSVTRHLWQVRAPLTVLVVRDNQRTEGNPWSCTTHRGPDRKTGKVCELSKCHARLVKTITGAQFQYLESYRHAVETSENEPAYGAVTIPEGLNLEGFHQKMGAILKAIMSAGETGMDSRTLESRLWPRSRKDRRKDIQIYVSKIRKRLDSMEPNRFAIRCDNGRYCFSDKGRP